MKKIYRVSIQGMYGYNEERYYSNKSMAEKEYQKKIDEKRKDKTTLDNDSCAEEFQQERNFTKIGYLGKGTESIKPIKGVFWSYGSMSDGEEPEFYSYTDQIMLEEIMVNETKPKSSLVEKQKEAGQER